MRENGKAWQGPFNPWRNRVKNKELKIAQKTVQSGNTQKVVALQTRKYQLEHKYIIISKSFQSIIFFLNNRRDFRSVQ